MKYMFEKRNICIFLCSNSSFIEKVYAISFEVPCPILINLGIFKMIWNMSLHLSSFLLNCIHKGPSGIRYHKFTQIN